MANGSAPNISDPTQYAGPPTQGNPTPPPTKTPGGGFMGILKNRILPAIGPITARLGAVYGNPMGLEEEYRQKQLQMQQAMLGPSVERAQAEAELARKQTTREPGTEEEALQHLRQQLGIERSMTPAVGVGPNGMPTEMQLSPTGPEGSLEAAPIPIRKAASVPSAVQTGAPDPFAAMAGTGSAESTPAPVSDASKTEGAPPSFMQPWMGGSKQQGKPIFNPETKRWEINEYYVTPYGMQQLPGAIPTTAPAGALPPKTYWPYLPGTVPGASMIDKVGNATLEDWANAANAKNTTERTGVTEIPIQQPDGSIVMQQKPTVTKEQRGVAPAGGTSSTPGVKPNAAGTASNVPRSTDISLPGAGKVVGGKVPGQVEKAYADYNSALQRQETMHKNYEDAIKSGGTNQQAEVSLLFNHIGMTQGAQKGARQSQVIIEDAARSAPFIKNFLAKYFDFDPKTKEYVLNTSGVDIKSGINLNPDQMKQMVDLGDQMVVAKLSEFQREQNAAKQGYGMGGPGQQPFIPEPINKAVNPPSTAKPRNAAEYLKSIGR